MSRSLFGGRTVCEACKAIEVRLWHRQGRLRVGACFSWSWTADGEPYGNIEVRVEEEAIVLSYRVRNWTATDWKLIEQRVPITWTDCHFGGCRPWFCCSVRANGRYCGRRPRFMHGVATGKKAPVPAPFFWTAMRPHPMCDQVSIVRRRSLGPVAIGFGPAWGG